MGEQCADHGVMCGEIGGIKAMISALKESVDKAVSRIDTHVAEAEKQGGIRDRVGLLEAAIRIQQDNISTIKQGYWKACIVSGVVGGLLARLCPDLIWSFLMNIVGIIK